MSDPVNDVRLDATLREIVAAALGRSRVPGRGDFSLRDAGLDSLAMIDLVSAIESGFAVRIRPEDIAPEHFSSFSGLLALVSARRTAGS